MQLAYRCVFILYMQYICTIIIIYIYHVVWSNFRPVFLSFQVNDTKYSAQTILDVYVEDENDNHPVFSQQSYQV